MNRLVRAVGGLAVEVVAIAREAILIPLRLWMSVAERAGAVTLAGWRLAYPRLVGLARALVLAVQIGERIATPARAAAVPGAAACVVLVIPQFVHYRGVQIGPPESRAVRSVAPPP